MTLTSKTISLVRNSEKTISLVRNSIKSIVIKIGGFFSLHLLGYFDPDSLDDWDSVLLGDMDGETMP